MSYTTYGPIEREMTARKEHKCSKCQKAIEPGTKYLRVWVPPWLDYEGDVDDEGRNIAYLLPAGERHSYTRRYHEACQGSYYGYY